MEKEDFLMRLTGSEEDEAGTTVPRLLYYNKVHTHTHHCSVNSVNVEYANAVCACAGLSGPKTPGGYWVARSCDSVSHTGCV